MAEKVVHTVWTVNNVLSQLDQLKKRIWTQEVIDVLHCTVDDGTTEGAKKP